MAATALSSFKCFSTAAFLFAILGTGWFAWRLPPRTQNTPMQQVGYIADALTAGNASDAMTPFDKSFPKYDKLSNYFGGLTSTFQLSNEVDLVDEQDDKAQTKLKVSWHLTLSDQQTNYTEQRSGEIDVTLSNASGKWKIVDFSPIDVFDPQQRTLK